MQLNHKLPYNSLRRYNNNNNNKHSMGSPLLLLLTFLFLGPLWVATVAAKATVFTLHNNCPYTVWPGTLSGNGVAVLGGGGFKLPSEATTSFSAPPGWSGRFWARTHCNFSASSSSSSCATGDCSGALHCTLGGATPVTLAEFTLASAAGGRDFYDVSLVDGYNVGIGISAAAVPPPPHAAAKAASSESTAACGYAGCVGDVNERCPPELRVSSSSTLSASVVVACRSACAAFGAAEYCCTGAYGSPSTCRPTNYSRIFKAACPAAYSYAYDDPTSTFTCTTGARYLITFCPSSKTPTTATPH